jgi:beta-phosphoglucomutase-like phosphatase (HAD superfamily)
MTAIAQPADPLNLVLNKRPAPFVPVAPVYEGLGPLQSHWMTVGWRCWRDCLDQAGASLLPLDYYTYLGHALQVAATILDTVYPPPAWLGMPRNMTPSDIAGCAIARQGDDLFWLDAHGNASWIAPDLASQRETEIAEKAHPYAHLWQEGHHRVDLADMTRRPAHQLEPVTDPTLEQADALLVSGRYDLTKALLARYPGNLPLYCYASSPYNALLGMLGFQGMMTAMVEAPDLVHQILESQLPRPAAHLLAARRLGIGIMFVEECLASADLISPRMYLEFSFPYTRRTLQFYEELGFRTVLYFSGNLMPFLSYLRDLPWTALSFEENRKNYGIDLAEVRRVMGPDRVLFGNVDAHWLAAASDQEVLNEARRQVALAGAAGNFVLSVGSPFTPETRLERVRFFCEATQMI